MTGVDEEFFAAGMEWDSQKEVLLLHGERISENQLIAALCSASRLLAAYAKRDKERLDTPTGHFLHWITHALCAVFIAWLLVSRVSS